MRQIRLEVVEPTADQMELRLYDNDGKLADQRPLDSHRVAKLLERVDRDYKFPFPGSLPELGTELYNFLDGETHRWLSRERDNSRKTLMVRIDVAGRLAHLPWELLRCEGVDLCALAKGGLFPVRQVGREDQAREVANRPLRLLLMACDPVGGGSSLSYEDEEARILEATRRPQVELEVEESGWLGGLEERLDDFGADYFDIFHLTGHAQLRKSGPVFVMETDEGAPQLVTPEELQEVFGDPWPRLLFLSGCETGKTQDAGALPSFCEALVQVGAPAVLGWGLPVFDEIASLAAAELYGELAKGKPIADAVASTRVALYRFEQDKQRLGGRANWHLLRLHTDGTTLGPLVTPLRAPGRGKLNLRPARQVFLDANAKSEVCTRDRFVGRRRPLQRSLRTLRTQPGGSEHSSGLLIHGMGGLGKSSLAARICERLRRRRLVIVGQLDEHSLLQKLSEILEDPDLLDRLHDQRRDLRSRLQFVVEGPLHTEPALFVLDDFERNVEVEAEGAPKLDTRGRAILRPEPLAVLTALLDAICQSGSDSRALITCRYELALPKLARLTHEALHHFEGAALDKKLSQLQTFEPDSKTSPELRERLKGLAGGNPRLLERLDLVVADPATDTASIVEAMEEVTETFREETLLRRLLAQQTPECRRLLAALSLLHLPVDRTAVEALRDTAEIDLELGRAVALGLVEKASEHPGEPETFFVSSILDPLLEDELDAAERHGVQSRATRHLYDVWWKSQGASNEPRALEVLRLALATKESDIAARTAEGLAHRWYNTARFREAVALCGAVTQHFEDYRVLMAWARSEEVLGQTDQAIAHYERAVGLTPPESEQDNEEKVILSATLHNMAHIVAQQGDIQRAMELWNRCLEVDESIGDERGRTATLTTMASIIAQQGEIQRAMELWNQSLEILERIGDAQGKAATLHNMAGIVAQQGDIQRAMELWKQSLEIKERIGDAQGKAATLNNMAQFVAQQGDIQRAMELWKQSLEILERIGDAKGKAATLANMAWAANQTGDSSRAFELNKEAARMLGEVRAFGDLITVAANLGATAKAGREVYLAQAFWLTSRIQAPLGDTLNIAAGLVNRLGPDSELALQAAATALLLIMTRGQEHPQFEQLQNNGFSVLGACAQVRDISPDEFQNWIVQEGLNDPKKTLPALFAALEELIGDTWLFDRTLFDD